MREDLGYWLALARFSGFGPVRMLKLSRRFSSMKSVFEASVTDLLEAGIEPEPAHRFLQERIHLDPQVELERLNTEGARAITLKDEDYPPILKTLYDPPAVLFVRGELPDPTRKHLAVVGSRQASGYGKDVARTLIEPLSRLGVVIVSGLAYGIDACAHQTCLDAGGTTVAVLGNGVDAQSIYPSQHRALSSHILARGGALISEFPFGTSPLKHHFPIRNRIIAGMCHGTLVIEAALKSGSLITARAALEGGRDVYAVPGPITSPLSEGPNNLIKMGAIPVTKPSDIFGLQEADGPEQASSYIPSNEDERLVLQALETVPHHIDEVIRQTQLPSAHVSSAITMLEMREMIRHDGGQYYRKVARR
ncbi:DNA-protecting protein DprA [Candidatus Uhrbacteria bacterium]|nr:DNA-protecting protein DprA [Candidatus Uhrbacteria bacterium]